MSIIPELPSDSEELFLPRPQLTPTVRHPQTITLAEVVEKNMGSSNDPDRYLVRAKTPTDQDRTNRNINVAARVDGSVN